MSPREHHIVGLALAAAADAMKDRDRHLAARLYGAAATSHETAARIYGRRALVAAKVAIAAAVISVILVIVGAVIS